MLRTPTKPTLQAMVSHFQKLFDVPSLRGVYPRMNEVYTRLAEMNNAMRNLRDILDIGVCVCVRSVGALWDWKSKKVSEGSDVPQD